MEPKAYPFQTGFLTEAGNVNTSKQYYTFIEKEGLACWIVTEQIDSSEEKESAKLAAEQIIGDFSQKPTLSRSKLKEYLTNAHQKLVSESGNIMLKASLVMMVSDYSRMVWAVSGNVRLYHFRDKVFNFRSQDQTMAQVMLDAGNLKEEEINRRNERSGLINYLGISTEFKPLISPPFHLREGDKILLCNLGLWEKVSTQDLTQALEGNEVPEQVLQQLQENWLVKSDKPLKQFIGTLIYVNQINGKKMTDYLTPQNVAACLSVLAIVGAGLLAGTLFSQSGMEAKKEQPPTINRSEKQPTVTNILAKAPKKTDIRNEVRQTQNSGTIINVENENNPIQSQLPESGRFEKRRKAELNLNVEDTGLMRQYLDTKEKHRQLSVEGRRKPGTSNTPRHRLQADAAGQKEPEGQFLSQRRKKTVAANGDQFQPQTQRDELTREKRQQEEVHRPRTKATTESDNKHADIEQQQYRRKPTEDLKKQSEAEELQHRRKEADTVVKQDDVGEQQSKRTETETLKKQLEPEEQQRRQKELDDLKKQQDAEEQQRRRKEAEAERRRKLKEAETSRKQQEENTRQQTRTTEVDRHQGNGSSAQTGTGSHLTRDAQIAQAKTLEKTGDEKYGTEKYGEALDLYKRAQRAYVELGMAVDASRVDQKINITINKKLESFLKRQLKK